MNQMNQVLANVFAKNLITNTSAPRYARLSFVDLVSATVLSKHFQRAIKSANGLFGIPADENVAVTRKVKHAKKAIKRIVKHAKKQYNKSVIVKTEDSSTGIIVPTKTGKRGRPKGSKNKSKATIAEAKPLMVELEEVDTDVIVENEVSDEDTPLNEL